MRGKVVTGKVTGFLFELRTIDYGIGYSSLDMLKAIDFHSSELCAV